MLQIVGRTYQGDDEVARRTFRDPQMGEILRATPVNHEYLMKVVPSISLSKEGKLQVLGYTRWLVVTEWLKSGMSNSFKDGWNKV